MVEIEIFGDIISDSVKQYIDGVAPSDVREQLKGAGGEPVELLINSPGGAADSGLTIYNMVKDYGGDTTSNIIGMAGSAASVVAVGSDTVKMANNSAMMVHGAQGILFGQYSGEELRDMLDSFDVYDVRLARTYANETGRPESYWSEFIKNDNYILPEKAIELGLADEITEGSEAEMIASQVTKLDYKSMPTVLAARFGYVPPPLKKRVEDNASNDDLAPAAVLFRRFQ